LGVEKTTIGTENTTMETEDTTKKADNELLNITVNELLQKMDSADELAKADNITPTAEQQVQAEQQLKES
jgi:hypothetical protein